MDRLSEDGVGASPMQAVSGVLPPVVGAAPEEVREERNCERHGPYTATGRMLPIVSRMSWSECPQCQAERDEAERAGVEAARLARLEAERQRVIGRAQIPRRFFGESFAQYVIETDAQRRAVDVCTAFAGALVRSHGDRPRRTGASLVLSGAPGTGKSLLACAVIQELMAAGGWGQYITAMDMVRLVRATWRRDSGESEDDVLRRLGEEIDLLVIDEIGLQYGTDGEQVLLSDVIDRRYREMRSTILITNQDKAGFRAYVGDRVFDRMTEIAQWVPFDWSSYRPAARREMLRQSKLTAGGDASTE